MAGRVCVTTKLANQRPAASVLVVEDEGLLRSLWSLRLLKSPWTEEDNERLKRLAAEGASALRVAAALKRKVSVVRQHARQIGLTLPSIRETRKKLTGSGNHPHRARLP
jgi:GcrA cell cycle regulator